MQPINRRHTHTPPPLLLLRGGDMRIDRIAAKPGKWRTFSKGLKGGGACRQLFRDDHNFSTLLIRRNTVVSLKKWKERERISNKTEERRKKGERGWLKSFNPSTSGGGNGSKHEARKTIKIGASWMASRHQPGVRWTRGWPSLPPLLFFPRAERHEEGRGWGEPSLGIKRVLRSARVWVVVTASLYTGTSTRAVAHLSSEPLFPFLLFSFIFFFFLSFPFLFFLPPPLYAHLCRASARSRLDSSASTVSEHGGRCKNGDTFRFVSSYRGKSRGCLSFKCLKKIIWNKSK